MTNALTKQYEFELERRQHMAAWEVLRGEEAIRRTIRGARSGPNCWYVVLI